jgi:TatA/E family protein of Tat protein translocase
LSADRFRAKNILLRDHSCCQYCGKQFAPSELTLDHIVPRSRGGESSWDNLVACCKRCNHKKGNRTPEESKMELLRRPRAVLAARQPANHALHRPRGRDLAQIFILRIRRPQRIVRARLSPRRRRTPMTVLLFAIESPTIIILVVAAIFLLFGGSKLPQLARALGQSKKAFKEGIDDANRDDRNERSKLESVDDESPV